jgi:hypothetical protein
MLGLWWKFHRKLKKYATLSSSKLRVKTHPPRPSWRSFLGCESGATYSAL